MATEIKKKPDKTVKSLSTPSRASGGSYAMSSDINLGDALVSTKSNRRATHMRWQWSISTSVRTREFNVGKQSISASNKKFSKSVNLNSVAGLTRQSFYPFTSERLYAVSIWVQPYNSYGSSKAVSKTRTFGRPAKPQIGGFAVDDETGIVSVAITSGGGDGYHERARTRYKVTIYNTRTKKTWTHSDSSFAGNSHTASYNVADYQQLSYGDYVQITVTAWNQGFCGDSETVTKTYYMGYPAQVGISSVSVSSREATGKCTVAISTNSTLQHPVDSVILEYLANCTYAKADQIPGDESWTVTQIVDDAQCTALAMPVASLIPDAGKYTWVRVRSVHAIPDVLYRYSEPKRVLGLETPAQSASDDDIKILSTALGADSESVIVHIGWNASGTDDATGTELSWADADDAWRSTDPPQTFEFEWSDGAYTDTSATPSVTYQDSAYITIKNLDPGQTAYIRARRYMDANGERTYGEYSNAKAQIPSSEMAGAPESVALSIPGFVARGKSALASWTVSSAGEQRSWALVTSDGLIIARDDGIATSYQIPFEALEAKAVNNVVTLHLEVSTGGDAIVSDDKPITIVDAPVVTIGALSTLTAQPLSFALTCNMAARIIATITAEGIGGQDAAGIYDQYAGDAVWYADLLPVWTISNDVYSVTITLDDGQPFVDGASYTLNVRAIDDGTGLQSEPVSAAFDVEWAHQAIAADDSTVTPWQYVDNDGVHHITATIGIVAPDGALSTDVYDIYRYTADGAVLVGSGYAGGDTAVDEYAPFGTSIDLYYRIVTRTADGDAEFAEIPYTLPCRVLRFDWPSGVLELPYNISISDSYSKDVARRMHRDGVQNAYWNPGVNRTARYTSELVRLDNKADIEAARQLARYPGAVFVRTPDGSAFAADVQVNELSTSGVIQVVSISITEIELTDDYKLMQEETESTP